MIVANLGRLDELTASGTLDKLTESLSRYVEKKELLCKAEELMATSALSFGPVPTITALWRSSGFPKQSHWPSNARRPHTIPHR
jgi:hypothetical protein